MKQTWGLIIADPNEIHESELIFLENKKVGQTLFNIYKWKEVTIIVVESGIGIVNAAMMTQKLIDAFKIDKILNYGAVGGTNNLKLFDIIIPQRFYFHDVETPWYPRSQTPGESQFYQNAFLETSHFNIASGNSFVYKEKHLTSIQKELDVDLFDMEVSAIAQVCFKNNIPFFSIKGISDIINQTNLTKDDINQNIAKASQKAFAKLISLFDLIKN